MFIIPFIEAPKTHGICEAKTEIEVSRYCIQKGYGSGKMMYAYT
jgi:hypothetical protein